MVDEGGAESGERNEVAIARVEGLFGAEEWMGMLFVTPFGIE